jgi:hypothetical protein
MHALRSLVLICAVVGFGAVAIAQTPGAPGAGDTFSTSTEAPGAAPPQGAVSPNAAPGACLDRVLRGTRAAVQAYQLVYSPGWKTDDECLEESTGAEFGNCRNLLDQARSLLEQAAALYSKVRQTPAPESEEINQQANALNLQAKDLVDQAVSCSAPIHAQSQENGGPPPPSSSAQGGPMAPPAAPLLLQGRVEKTQGPPNGPDAQSDCASTDSALQQSLMDLAAQLDRIVDNATDYTLAGTDRFFDVAAQAVSVKLKSLAHAASNPPAAAEKTVDTIVTYVASDYNANNDQMYDAAVQAADQIEKDPAAFFAQFAVDSAATAEAGAVAGRVFGCVSGAAAAANAAKRAEAIAEAKTAAQSLENMETTATQKAAQQAGAQQGAAQQAAAQKAAAQKAAQQAGTPQGAAQQSAAQRAAAQKAAQQGAAPAAGQSTPAQNAADQAAAQKAAEQAAAQKAGAQ